MATTTDKAVAAVRELLATPAFEVVDRDTLAALLYAAEAVADMHAAAVGEVRGPIRGVVEDVQDAVRKAEPHTLSSDDPEPPDKSVVIDREGDAWQRDDDSPDPDTRWMLAGSDYTHTGRFWDDLTSIYGPVRLVYTPEG